jgi:GTP1/Obg family GTP-binding protein
MLTVSGLCVIPAEPQLKLFENTKGAWFNFTIVSIDEKKDIHRYQANMFVKKEQIEEWKNKITSGNVFHIDIAKWRMKEWEGGKYPFPVIELSPYNFKKLTQPFWAELHEDLEE